MKNYVLNSFKTSNWYM